jgi:hypothetical protein
MVTRLLLALFCTFSCAFASEAPSPSEIAVNPVAVEFARQLIQGGHVIWDKRGAWTHDQPSARRKTEFLHLRGPEHYGKWHLAIDRRHGIDTEAHYKFPFGDFENLHRCGLLAAKARAREYRYVDIEAAATELLQLLDSIRPSAQKRVD